MADEPVSTDEPVVDAEPDGAAASGGAPVSADEEEFRLRRRMRRRAQGLGTRYEVSWGTPAPATGSINRSSAAYIQWVQRSLNQIMGLQLAVDGIAGPATRTAVRGFQQRNGLVTDGVVGPVTEGALIAAGAAAPPRTSGGTQPQPSAPAPIPSNLPPLRTNLARTAVAEWERWRRGTATEGDSTMRSTLRDYWLTGTGINPETIGDASWWSAYPWSAAFISWVARKAGAGPAFTYSSSHSKYIAAAKQNRLSNNSNPFKAYRVTEAAPRVGDLVCASRNGSGATYDNIQYPMATHCDVVTEVRPGQIAMIGGNVSNSVTRKLVSTDQNGFVNKADYFAVIRAGN
jgi:hypothetical protein